VTALTTRVLQPIERATNRVEREQAEVAAEQQAFQEFADRVAEIDLIQPGATLPAGQALMIPADGDRTEPMDQVRIAYEETVMSVEHYDREYGESFRANLGAEIGAEAAAAICDGATHLFTSPFRTMLVTAAQQSQQERADFLDTLDQEAKSLSRTRDSLSQLLTTLEKHTQKGSMTIDGPHRERIIDRLELLVSTRQDLLNSRTQRRTLTGRDLCEYLYHVEDWTYPVLRAAAVFRDVVASRQR
jgi:hypothetical protein